VEPGGTPRGPAARNHQRTDRPPEEDVELVGGVSERRPRPKETGREEGEAVLGLAAPQAHPGVAKEGERGLRLAHCEQQREAGGTEAHIPPEGPHAPEKVGGVKGLRCLGGGTGREQQGENPQVQHAPEAGAGWPRAGRGTPAAEGQEP